MRLPGALGPLCTGLVFLACHALHMAAYCINSPPHLLSIGLGSSTSCCCTSPSSSCSSSLKHHHSPSSSSWCGGNNSRSRRRSSLHRRASSSSSSGQHEAYPPSRRIPSASSSWVGQSARGGGNDDALAAATTADNTKGVPEDDTITASVAPPVTTRGHGGPLYHHPISSSSENNKFASWIDSPRKFLQQFFFALRRQEGGGGRGFSSSSSSSSSTYSNNSQNKSRTAATRLYSTRERVHISRFDDKGDGEEGASSSSNNAPATDSQSIPTSKSVTCLSYDLFQGRSDADIAVRKQQQEQEGGGGGDAGEEEEDTGLFYYLGGSASTFLKYIQQELSRPEAKDEGVEHEQIDDLVTQKERFARLWRAGRLIVEDPNTLDVINNRTSFRELLMTYTHRMKKTDEDPITSLDILSFLRREYGPEHTDAVIYKADRPPIEAMAALKHFLTWFKEGFPYYKSACLHCGNLEHNSMIGVVSPSETERLFNATLTEVYCCSKCQKVYRFPRSVTISRVMETRRGRCGEYSRLFFKAMEALRYKTRWVVDWEDHVWVEVDLPGRGWVHMDPCEAAVDEPLLYQSWGKNQTYILAFTREEVADVTHIYTSDFEAARMRRKVPPEEFATLLDSATGLLKQRPEEPGSARAIASSTSVIRKKRGSSSTSSRQQQQQQQSPPSSSSSSSQQSTGGKGSGTSSGGGGGGGGQRGSSSSSRNKRGAGSASSASPTA